MLEKTRGRGHAFSPCSRPPPHPTRPRPPLGVVARTFRGVVDGVAARRSLTWMKPVLQVGIGVACPVPIERLPDFSR